MSPDRPGRGDDPPTLTASDAASAFDDADERAEDGPRDRGADPRAPFDDAGGGDDLGADNDDLTDEPASDPTDDTTDASSADPTDEFDGEGGAPACGTDTACE